MLVDEAGRGMMPDSAHGSVCECRNEVCGQAVDVGADEKSLILHDVCRICQDGSCAQAESTLGFFLL